ncbi:MAG: hypothetical protein Q9227_004143 [Pyrenula ochraceoflavens]
MFVNEDFMLTAIRYDYLSDLAPSSEELQSGGNFMVSKISPWRDGSDMTAADKHRKLAEDSGNPVSDTVRDIV